MGVAVAVFFFGVLLGTIVMSLLVISKRSEPNPALRVSQESAEKVLWHLTSRGWISEGEAFLLGEQKGVPADRVLSLLVENPTPLGMTRMQEVWRCPDEQRAGELLERFGESPPEVLLTSNAFVGDTSTAGSRFFSGRSIAHGGED